MKIDIILQKWHDSQMVSKLGYQYRVDRFKYAPWQKDMARILFY